MTVDEVIDAYVRDVARFLPRKKRNDVAFELRALLADELAEKARSEGRPVDRAMVMTFLAGFGRPAEVAQRYHPRPAIIDPADSHHFLLWTVAGTVLISALSGLNPEKGDAGAVMTQWLGMLVIVFAIIAWWWRKNPNRFSWKPKHGPDWMPRSLSLLALVATLIFPFFVYAAPTTFVETMFFGKVTTKGLALTEGFLGSWQRFVTLGLLGALVAVYATTTVLGGWRRWLRWTSTWIHLALGLLLAGHATPMAPLPGMATYTVFQSPTANATAGPIFALTGTMIVLTALYAAYQEWASVRPAPEVSAARA